MKFLWGAQYKIPLIQQKQIETIAEKYVKYNMNKILMKRKRRESVFLGFEW